MTSVTGGHRSAWSARDRNGHLRARADVRREVVPATHGAELRSSDGGWTVELVDRRVDPLRGPFSLAGQAFRYLTGGHIAPTAPHPPASERVRQVNRGVPPIPSGFDGGVDLDGHDQQALREFGHDLLQVRWRSVCRSDTPDGSCAE